MTSDLPDHWFRGSGPGPDEADPAGAPPTGAPAGSGATAGDEERWTDQFKPDYLLQPGARRPAPDAARRSGLPPQSPSQQGEAAATGAASGSTASVSSPRAGVNAAAAGAQDRGRSHSVGVEPTRTRDEINERRPRSRTRTVLPVAGGVVLLLAAALGAQRYLSDDTTTDPQSQPVPNQVSSLGAQHPVATTGADSSATPGTATAGQTPWMGPVHVVQPTAVQATCTAPAKPAYDGTMVPGSASRLIDSSAITGWRCDGAATGQKLTFTFPKGTSIVGLRLTNGYTKTVQGEDLYPEYRRLTQARWSIPGGAFFVQSLKDGDEQLQETRIAETPVDAGITMEVLATTTPGHTSSSRDALVLTQVQFLAR